jgi:hypothetical protein
MKKSSDFSTLGLLLDTSCRKYIRIHLCVPRTAKPLITYYNSQVLVKTTNPNFNLLQMKKKCIFYRNLRKIKNISDKVKKSK